MRNWPTSAGPPLSRSCCATTAERLPPALSPATRHAAVTLELAGVLGDPAGGGDGVVGRGREGRLGREPVVDRDDDRVAAPADVAGHVVVGVEVADDEAATVEEGDDRERPVALGSVEPGLEVALGAAHREVAGLADRHDVLGCAHAGGHAEVGLPALVRRALLDRRCLHRGEHVEDGGDVRVDRHSGSPRGAMGGAGQVRVPSMRADCRRSAVATSGWRAARTSAYRKDSPTRTTA